MTNNGEHGVLCKFIKMKTLVFYGTEYEDANEFLIDCHEHQHKIGIFQMYSVEFVSFQL